jgi:hypothetical protein
MGTPLFSAILSGLCLNETRRSQPNWMCLFAIRPGEIYTFGNVYVNLLGPDGENSYDESLELGG